MDWSVVSGRIDVDPVAWLSSLDPIAAAFLAFVGLLVVGDGFRSLQDYWRFRAPATTVDTLVPGRNPVEVEGIAAPRAEATVTGPFTDTSCLICAYTVEAYYDPVTGLDEGLFDPTAVVRPEGWTEEYSGLRAVPFYVDDGTAKLLVDPADAALRLSAHETTVADGDPLPAGIQRFVDEMAETGDEPWAERLLESDPPSGFRRLGSLFEWEIDEWRFTEHRLGLESPVAVYGVPSRRRTERDEIGVVHAIISRGPADGSDSTVVTGNRSRAPLVISDTVGASLERRLFRLGVLKGMVGITLVGSGALGFLF